MLRYLFTLAGVLVILYVVPFLLARSPLYDRVNPSFYARPLNYPYKTAGENADVVIFGDSTALLGIDPSQMSAALGVKVLNLGNTQPSLVVDGDMSLRYYLGANRPPRLIVFYFAPWDFDYGNVDFNARPVFEGEELLIRRGTMRAILSFAWKHPQEALLFPLRLYASDWDLTTHRIPRPDQDAQLAATRGHVDNLDKTTLQVPCHFPQYLIDNIRFPWVRSLAQKYRTPETRILFYVAPVPACDNVSMVVGRPYDQLPARPPKQISPEFFIKDIRFIHPHTAAVPQLSEDLADAVRPLLSSANTPTADSR